MDTSLQNAATQDFGPGLIRAIAQEFYKLCYPQQSLDIPLEDRTLGSQGFINKRAIAVLQSMRIDENRLDSITVAEAIYNQRWASHQGRSPFQSLPRVKQQEYLDIADRMVNFVISGDYDA